MLVEVKIYDDDTGEVEKSYIEIYTGNLGWEVEHIFNKVGFKFAKIMDEGYEP